MFRLSERRAKVERAKVEAKASWPDNQSLKRLVIKKFKVYSSVFGAFAKQVFLRFRAKQKMRDC